VVLRFSTITDGPAHAEMEAAVAHKLEFVTSGATGWTDSTWGPRAPTWGSPSWATSWAAGS
jgi:hypothetical protein